MLPDLPPARELIGDRGHDSGRFRGALAARGITACIPSTRSRKVPIPHDADLCRQRHRIEIMFGRLKDWHRIATRYDRCAHSFFSAVTVAAIVTFWLGQWVLTLVRRVPHRRFSHGFSLESSTDRFSATQEAPCQQSS